MENTLIQFAHFIAHVLGPTTEIALHNMNTSELVVLENGNITGRHLGEKNAPATTRVLHELAAQGKEEIIGYRGYSINGHPLRSSNLFIHDETGALQYIFCVNQDITNVEQIQTFLKSFSTSGTPFAPPSDISEPSEEASVESLTMNLIFSEIERMNHSSVDTNTKEARLSIIRRLDEKGVFDVRKTIPKVCEILNISQATLYNYLKEIHST